jgi:hypothetical protein
VSTSDGLIVENKVTKRAVETGLGEGAVGYSEYARVAEADAQGLQASVPKIFGVRRLQRLKLEGDGSIRGVERMYVYRGDSLDLKDEPLAVVKSSFIMTRSP